MSGHKRNPREQVEKKPLTHGWIVVPSKTYPDRVYFYNTITRCSTWNNPCEDSSEKSSESRRSKSSSPQKRRSSKVKSSSPAMSQERRIKCSPSLHSANRNRQVAIENGQVDSEIEDYDEQQDQYFKNVPVNAFSLSHSNFFGASSPDSVSSFKNDVSDSDSSKCNSLLENNEKELWLHFVSNSPKSSVKKSVALSDMNEASTSVKNSGMERIEDIKKKFPFPESFMRSGALNPPGIHETENSDIFPKRKKSKKKKKKRRDSQGETFKKGIEEKIIKNVSFKKKDKTPAQTRLLKLRKQNAEKLKELAVKNPDLFASKTADSSRAKKSFDFVGKEQSGSNTFNDAYLKWASNLREEAGNFSRDEFDEEMDWEPSSEENDVRNINVYRQQLDKANDSSSDIFFGLKSDHSLPLPSKSHSWFVALDTNIFVSCLGFVKDLRDIEVPELGYPVIYVPWRVLQELDHLKDTKFYTMDKHLHGNVRKAIAYLNENFQSGHPRVFGQSFEEFAKMIDVGVSAPDDEILQTCITFQREHPNKKLMLLTNDKNLESKAIVSGVEAYSKDRFQKKYLSSGSILPAPTFNKPSIKTTAFASAPIGRAVKIDNCVCEVKSILKDFLPLVVETEMKIAFEGDWVKLAFKKPPWNLQDALECLLKHWRSVFFLVFSKETQCEAQRLYERLFKKEPESAEEIIDIIKTVQRLVLSIKRSQKKKRPYLDLVEGVILKLSSLLTSLSPNLSSEVESCLSPLVPSTPIQDTPFCPTQSVPHTETRTNDIARVKNLFKEIWDSLRSFCCSISDVVNSSGIYGTTDLEEVRRKMSQVISEVTELVLIIEKIFQIAVTDLSETHPSISYFSNFLIRVHPTLDPDLQCELPKCLAAFFTDFEGRFLLNSSLKDFKEFSHDLTSAAEYLNAHLTG